MPRRISTAACVALLLCSTAWSQTVNRNLADPKTATWVAGAYNSAPISIGSSKDVPPQMRGKQADSLQLTVQYAGKGFQFSGAGPASPAVPGKLRSVRGWIKPDKPGCAWILKFKDAQGNEKAGAVKLEHGPKTTPGSWTQFEFQIPASWPQPLQFGGVAAHNWSSRNETTPTSASVLLAGLEVTTDVSGVKDKASLVRVSVDSGMPRNLFVEGETVAYRLVADSWLGKPVAATVRWTVTDSAGKTIASKQRQLRFEGAASADLDAAPGTFGVFTIAVDAKLDSGNEIRTTSRYAYLPKTRELTEAQKTASPWGLNIHGGMEGVSYQGIAKSGVTWVRDYAYTWEWIGRARGDGSYGGWPWYPRLKRSIDESGLMLLPCLSGAMKDSILKQGNMTPPESWRRELMRILLDFPQWTCWEIDNEYDLWNNHEPKVNWESYGNFHKVFGQGVHFIDPKLWTVENGTSGIHPERVRMLIERGDFDNIDVVNAHFYCGTMPPEIAAENANTGQQDEPPVRVYDLLRELAAAADCDGKDRQAWITEFGWDTLAGHIVTEHQQAAYLPRAYMLMTVAGIDKVFWYWNRDTKGVPSNFFDGCGIFDPKDEPKPVVATMAAMANLLVRPEGVGLFDLGPNAMGFVVRDEGKYIAGVFKTDPKGEDLTVDLPDGKLLDMFGNPLPNGPHKLDVGPIWIVGLPADHPFVQEAAFDLASRYLVRITAGDTHTLKLRVRGSAEAVSAPYEVKLPAGWTAGKTSGTINTPAGKDTVVEIPVVIDPREADQVETITVTVGPSGARRTLETEVRILPAATLKVAPLARDSKTELHVDVTNNASTAKDFTVRVDTPAGWTVTDATQTVKALEGKKTRSLRFPLTWKPGWSASEKAIVSVATDDGKTVATAGIQPPAIELPKVAGVKLDGDLSDWPAAAKLPDWLTGTNGPDAKATVYAGWTDEGLVLAVRSDNSKVHVTDPKSFWACDAIEAFVDAADDKTARKQYAKTDHQFWVCPQPKTGGVYAGRWKRNDEIPDTQYDLKSVRGATKTVDGGYVMEFLIPTSAATKLKLVPGGTIGLNLNLTVQTPQGGAEVYWPRSKFADAATAPANWGTVTLGR